MQWPDDWRFWSERCVGDGVIGAGRVRARGMESMVAKMRGLGRRIVDCESLISAKMSGAVELVGSESRKDCFDGPVIRCGKEPEGWKIWMAF